MNYTQQYHAEFDRIWSLIRPILRNNKQKRYELPDSIGFAMDDDDPELDIFWGNYTYVYVNEKNELIKDDHHHLIHGESFEEIIELEIKQIILSTIFTAKNEEGEWVLEEGNKANPEITTIKNNIDKIDNQFKIREIAQNKFDLLIAKKSIKNPLCEGVDTGYSLSLEAQELQEIRNQPQQWYDTLFYQKWILETEIEHMDPTLRDLFRKNCIPANDDEQDQMQIENLKLINW